jgi:hypothetical protein
MNNQDIYQHTLPEGYHLKIAAITVSTYITLLLFGMLPLLLNKDAFKNIFTILFAIAVIDSIWMLVRSVIYGPDQCYAMMSNSAIDASFIACFIPIALSFFKKREIMWLEGIFLLIPMVLAIIVSKSSTGIAGIGIAIASYLFMEYGLKSLKIIAPLALAICGGAYIYLKDELLNPNGRYGIWKGSLDFFLKETHILIGSGIGTFFMWGPEIQMHNNNSLGSNGQQALFIWMHNDWLQVLFEMGIIGLAGLIILYSCLLLSSWKKKNALFPMLCTYGFIGLTQMPLRAFPFQVLGACLIIISFKLENSYNCPFNRGNNRPCAYNRYSSGINSALNFNCICRSICRRIYPS